jgi:hypothetical protein
MQKAAVLIKSVEIGLKLLGREFIRTAIKMIPQSPYGSCVCIPVLLALALKLEHS